MNSSASLPVSAACLHRVSRHAEKASDAGSMNRTLEVRSAMLRRSLRTPEQRDVP